ANKIMPTANKQNSFFPQKFLIIAAPLLNSNSLSYHQIRIFPIRSDSKAPNERKGITKTAITTSYCDYRCSIPSS
ncbi:MAG: hypothetical protein RR332_03750, partial [Clostridiales bacterium]